MKPAFILLGGLLFLSSGCDSTVSQREATDAPAPAPIETPTGAPTTLDLSREHMSDDIDEVELAEDEALLPDLLGNENEEGKVKLSGGVITDKEAPTLMDRIDGAEVKLEVKTP